MENRLGLLRLRRTADSRSRRSSNLSWWAEEASNEMLTTYDHPTPQSLMLPEGRGDFRSAEDGMSYAHLAVWLGYLGLGYGLALDVPIAHGRR